MPSTIREFEIPEFLKPETADEIYARWSQLAKENGTDVTEGSLFFQAMKPIAVDQAERDQYKRIELFKLMWPDWSYDVWLELLGEAAGTSPKKEPTYSEGSVTVTGVVGTLIPIDFMFATKAVGDKPSVIFKAKQSVTIDGSGTANVAVKAVEAGTIGNVDAGSITLMSIPINGVVSITNAAATTGGTDIENEENYRLRVKSSNEDEKLSGADSDFKRWAEEVPGVGRAYIDAGWDGVNTVKIIVVDANGAPANSSIVDAVQEYIAPAGENREGFCPVGTVATVVAPSLLELDFALSWELSDDVDAEETEEKFKAALLDYYMEVGVGGLIRYNRIGAILISTEGVINYSGLTINGDTYDVQLEPDEYAGTGTVVIT